MKYEEPHVEKSSMSKHAPKTVSSLPLDVNFCADLEFDIEKKKIIYPEEEDLFPNENVEEDLLSKEDDPVLQGEEDPLQH